MTKTEKNKKFVITTYDYDGVPIDWYEFFGEEKTAKSFGEEKSRLDYAMSYTVSPLLNLTKED